MGRFGWHSGKAKANSIEFTPSPSPVNPTAGEMYFDSTTLTFWFWDGSAWKQVATV